MSDEYICTLGEHESQMDVTCAKNKDGICTHDKYCSLKARIIRKELI